MTPPSRDTSVSTLADRTHPLEVDDPSFLVDRLHADCAPGQFVREITENAKQGIESLTEQGETVASGSIYWDVDWETWKRTGAWKLCCIDTGVGMTGPEMVEYINKLTKSSHLRSNTANFGVGAKISAVPRNPVGLLYLSWKNGHGAMVHVWRDPITGVYGLRQLQLPDGTFSFWLPLSDEIKPKEIKNHGTKVVFLGRDEHEDTMQAPEGVVFPKKWVLRYLNGRYFRFPKGVTVHAREGWTLPRNDKHNFLRTITGMEPWLSESKAASGILRVTGCDIRWWILRDDADRDSGHYPVPGFVGALFQNELYDLATQRSGVSRLQSFGIIFGHQRVVLVAEPIAEINQKLTANTARTTLLLNGESLPWAEWAAEFRARMPKELEDLQAEVASKTSSDDNRQKILERLQQIRDLFKFSRYRLSPSGTRVVAPEEVNQGGSGGDGLTDEAVERPPSAPRKGGKQRAYAAGNVYASFAADTGLPAEQVPGDSVPEVAWLSAADGSRSKGDLEDRAARFVHTSNKLLINADFRVFTDMISRWAEKYRHVPGATEKIKVHVREWFEQQLIEAVMSAKSLATSREWTETDVQTLWSEESLTAVVLPRYHIDKELKRRFGNELGPLGREAA